MGENKHLQVTDIKVKFSLDEISSKFGPLTLKHLVPNKALEFKLPFWIPEGQKPLVPLSSDENLLKFAKIELVSWLTKHFGGLLENERLELTADHAITYVYHSHPIPPINGTTFHWCAKAVGLNVIIDDLFDDPAIFKNIPEEGNTEFAPIYKKIIKMLRVSRKHPISNPVWQEMSRNSGRFQKAFISAVTELDALFDRAGSGVESGLNEFGPEIAAAFEACEWMKEQVYSSGGNGWTLETCRFVRGIEAAIFWVNIAYSLEHGRLPEWLNYDPMFQAWVITAKHINAMLNDILGFKKDVVNGEPDNMIFYHMANGLTLEEAVSKETNDFGGYVREYLKLRDYLLSNATYARHVKMYLSYMDNAMGGVVQVFQGSKKYCFTTPNNKIEYGI